MIIRKEDVHALDFNGLTIYDYTSQCQEQSSFAVITVPVHVRHQLSWSKRSDKYYYIMDGKLTFTINDKKDVLKKGDFCVIKKGDKFYYENTFKKVASLVLVHTPNFHIDEEVFE